MRGAGNRSIPGGMVHSSKNVRCKVMGVDALSRPHSCKLKPAQARKRLATLFPRRAYRIQ